MQLGEIEGLKQALWANGFGEDPFWSKGPSDVSDTDIQLFYARAGLKGKRQEAIDLIDQAQAAVVVLLCAGQLPQGAFSSLVLHETPPPPYLADEFVDGLAKLRPSRRSACIFLLENRLSAQFVLDLTWQQLDARPPGLRNLSETSQDVIKVARAQRNQHLPYVFWEWVSTTITSPLLELAHTIEQAFDCTMPELQDRYSRMIMINRRAESASFLDLVKQQGRN